MQRSDRGVRGKSQPKPIQHTIRSGEIGRRQYIAGQLVGRNIDGCVQTCGVEMAAGSNRDFNQQIPRHIMATTKASVTINHALRSFPIVKFIERELGKLDESGTIRRLTPAQVGTLRNKINSIPITLSLRKKRKWHHLVTKVTFIIPMHQN